MSVTPYLNLEDIEVLSDAVPAYDQIITEVVTKVNANNNKIDSQVNLNKTRVNESTGYGILSGLNIIPQTTPNMSVRVLSGIVYMINGDRYMVNTNENLIITAADSINPRIDIIYVGSVGTVGYLAGTANITPIAPTLPNGSILLAEISVPANITIITNENIIDKRLIKYNNNNLNSQINDIAINIKNYGAVGDGITDDTNAIINAINVIKTIPNITLLFPKSNGYLTTQPIVIPIGINVKMDSPIIYNGSGIALTIGEETKGNLNMTFKLNVARNVVSDWTSESDIGIKIINAYHCNFDIVQSLGFTIGVQYIGIGMGCTYNNSNLRYISNNKYDIDLTNGLNGWCNENIFIGGRFTVHSDVVNTDESYAIRINSLTSYLNNSNVFIKPSFEGKNRVPILCNYGSMNSFEDCRFETELTLLAKFNNNSSLNKITTGFDDTTTTIEDNSIYKNNIYMSGRKLYQRLIHQIYAVNDLQLKATEYTDTSADYTHIQGCLLCKASGGAMYKAYTGVKINANYLEISTTAIGIYIDTSTLKNLVVGGKRVIGNGGRVIVICYDENGNRLTDAKTYVRSDSNISIAYNANYGGCWQTGSDSNNKIPIRIDNDVKKIWVGIGVGSQPLKISSFVLETYDKENNVNISCTPNMENKRLAIKAPTGALSNTQIYNIGTIIFNDSPVEQGEVGSKYVIIGWICVTAGSPGVWLPLRNLTGN